MVDLSLLDFSKAFNVVNYATLIIKLKSLRVSDYFLEWINASLTDRTMSVVVGSDDSRSRLVRSGIPLGSILGHRSSVFGLCKFPY